MKIEFNKKEIEMILEWIRIDLESYTYSGNKGIKFTGDFDKSLPKEDRDIMESIYKKCQNQTKQEQK